MTPCPTAARRPLGVLLRLTTSLGLLAAIAWWLELDEMSAAVTTVSPGWVALALAISIPQVMLSAWRWRLTASCLGAAIPFRTAVREYYLGSFVNQIMPGGVLGDAARAWRHARTLPDAREAWHAVLIERASGQLALLACGVVALAFSPSLANGVRDSLAGAWNASPPLVLLLGGASIAAMFAALASHPGSLLRRFTQDVGRGLLASRVWPRQAVASLLVVASYVAVFICCARAIGDSTPVATLAPLLTLVLMAMTIPVSVAGWGVREGAAALIWLMAGLEPTKGVAISIAYGAVVLVATLPGAWVLLTVRRDASLAIQASPPRRP